MRIHYSQPKGFVGRNICYAITHRGEFYGYTVGGSATLHLPNRNEYFNITRDDLNHIVNNTFFHVEGPYPFRNFVPAVVEAWREAISQDWYEKYNDTVLGFETLVELPRTGECYKRDGWEQIGQTKGYTCRRGGGNEVGRFTGERVWNYTDLRPKLVLVRINN
jgi:hypothetical protein